MQLLAKFMNRSIKTYKDLVQEEQRLLAQLKAQEKLIKEDLTGIKEGLKPFGNAMRIVNKLVTRDHTGPLMNFGLDFSIDLLIRKLLLARAGWITKIVIPFIVKNYSSHIISEDKRAKLVKKIQDIFNKIRPRTNHQQAGTAQA